MKNSIVCLSLFLAALFTSSQVEARQITWLTNYDEAVQQSRNTSKPILLFFTGSDWCKWCIRLDEDTLRTPDFADTVGDKFIFVKLDFPLNSKQSPEATAQGKMLKKKYDISGYPHIIILDAKTQKPIGSTGYRPESGKQFGQHLLKIVEGHSAYEHKLNNLGDQQISGGDLRLLYDEALSLKRECDANCIAAAGLDSDQRHFFLLERYRHLSEQGRNNSEEALSMRRQLLDADPLNRKLTHYQVAVIDFDASCRDCNRSLEATVCALTDYIQKFGEQDRDHLWRLEMLVSQVYFEKNQLSEALRHAKSSYESAPQAAQPEIAIAIHSIEEKIPAQK